MKLSTHTDPEPILRPAGRPRGYQQKHGWSEAERNILAHLAEGKMPIEIANGRSVSYYTVRRQIQLMRERAGVHTTRELVEAWRAEGAK